MAEDLRRGEGDSGLVGRGGVRGWGDGLQVDKLASGAGHGPTDGERDESTMKRVEIVVPLYNEASCLAAFYRQLCLAIDGLPYRFRVILVDDGSTDATAELCRALAQRDPRVRYVRLSRNFGHQAALTAGLDVAEGDAVLTMDSDLQHPPECIQLFIQAWERGAEVVHGRRGNAQEGLGKDLSSKVFYRLLRPIVSIPVVPDAPDYCLLDRRAAFAMRRLREQGRFLRGMYAWIGFKQETVVYPEGGRYAGRSKYTAPRMVGLAMAAVLGFSRAPLRAATCLGAAVSCCALVFGSYMLYRALWSDAAVPGWTSVAVLVSLLSGVQLLTLGIVGEYLGQVLDEVKRRPLYLVAEDSVDVCALSGAEAQADRTDGR